MNPVFSIAIKPDKITGVSFIPYLLENSEAGNFYKIVKQLNIKDIGTDLIDEAKIEQLIELCDSLKYEQLNRKLNKKYDKIDFEKFYEEAEKQLKKHILRAVDNRKNEVLDFVKDYDILLFYKDDRHFEAVYNESVIDISANPLKIKFDFEKKEGFLHYRLRVFDNGQVIDLKAPNTIILTNNNPAIIYKSRLYWFENNEFNGNKLKPFLKKDEIVVNEKLQGDFFKKFIMPVVKKFEFTISGFDLVNIKPVISSELVIEKTFFGNIILVPVFKYGDNNVEFYKEQQVFVNVLERKGEYYLESIKRDRKFEEKMLNKLISFGLKKAEKYFYLSRDMTDKYLFAEQFAKINSEIKNAGFRVINHLFDGEVNYSVPEIRYETKKRRDWFDLHIVIKVGDNEINFKQLKNHILNRIPEYRFKDGSVFVIPSVWFSELRAFAERTENDVAEIHISQLNLLKNNKLISPDETISESLKSLEITKLPGLPENLKADLREYQKAGFYRLYHFTQNGFGICLADDMGLGKTLQVITVLQKYFENKQPVDTKPAKINGQLSLFNSDNATEETVEGTFNTALIIVPKSLVYNWIEELKKFAPELTYFVYQNKNRLEVLEKKMDKVNIVLATYGVIRQDIESLQKFEFGYLIVDESQVIKNPNSKIFKAVTLINSAFRISMTGTPIENNLYDLWSQMSFLNHNLLGNLRYFEKNYVNPIVKFEDEYKAQELKELVGPFILRRMKNEVATELPEKIEQIIYCPMNELQSEIYETEKSSIRNRLLQGEIDKKNYVEVLAVLHRLRQIAIHPGLLDEYKDDIPSGKYETIIETMENLLEEGHKFLVFSSFVKHLKLFRKYFEEKEIAYSMLTGSDNNRKEIVERFQNDDSVKPFLISIKAGGTGLNITAATYVLIIDPWWNPFVEQQAIDRTHRIGQTKNVNIYKFITKDSVEEKMLMLQRSKLELSDSIINANASSEMTTGEIEKLLLNP